MYENTVNDKNSFDKGNNLVTAQISEPFNIHLYSTENNIKHMLIIAPIWKVAGGCGGYTGFGLSVIIVFLLNIFRTNW